MLSRKRCLPLPRKSSSDKKEYRAIRLENGLRALLIADTTYSLDKLDEEEKDAVEEEMELDEEDGSDEDTGDDENDEEEEEEDEEEETLSKRAITSNTGLKMSAAALCVHMGSFSDPEDVPGLAHFLEHMVFMGVRSFLMRTALIPSLPNMEDMTMPPRIQRLQSFTLSLPGDISMRVSTDLLSSLFLL